MNINFVLRTSSVVVGIAAIATAVCYRSDYLPYLLDRETLQQQIVDTWNHAYAADTYGGKTPEETLQLFVDALKKGDIKLASKYFLVDEQKEIGEYLKKEASITLMIDQLGKAKLDQSEERATLTLSENGKLVSDMSLIRLPNGIWKIAEL